MANYAQLNFSKAVNYGENYLLMYMMWVSEHSTRITLDCTWKSTSISQLYVYVLYPKHARNVSACKVKAKSEQLSLGVTSITSTNGEDTNIYELKGNQHAA